MTYARALRNRANARRSTGPRTDNGKRRSSRNARRHGATARPELGEVTLWLRVILDDVGVDADDILDADERMTAALALAEAEASLVAAERALEAFERGKATPSDMAKMFYKERDLLLDWMSEFEMEGMMTQQDRVYTAKLLLRQGSIIHQETSIGGKRHKLLQLYAKRARSRRQKAFDMWLEICDRRAERHVEKTKPDRRSMPPGAPPERTGACAHPGNEGPGGGPTASEEIAANVREDLSPIGTEAALQDGGQEAEREAPETKATRPSSIHGSDVEGHSHDEAQDARTDAETGGCEDVSPAVEEAAEPDPVEGDESTDDKAPTRDEGRLGPGWGARVPRDEDDDSPELYHPVRGLSFPTDL